MNFFDPPKLAWLAVALISLAGAWKELETPTSGPVRLNFEATAGEVWIDFRKISGPGESIAELSTGTHRVLVRIDPKNIPDSIILKSSDGTFLVN